MALTITGTPLLERAEPTTLGKRVGPVSGHRASRIVPSRGWVRLEDEDDPGLALLCRLGEGNLDITNGVGGWDVVHRPGRNPVTRWRGRTELRVDVPLWLNSERRESVESQVTTLVGLAGRGSRGRESEPPHIIFDTAGVSPFDVQTFPDDRWVIDALTWGTNVLSSGGNRYRQDATITLLRFVDDQIVTDQSLALRRRQRRGKLSGPKRYHVKKGDTLVSIARRELGSVDRWIDIRRLNPGAPTDPRRELKPPLTLRLR